MRCDAAGAGPLSDRADARRATIATAWSSPPGSRQPRRARAADRGRDAVALRRAPRARRRDLRASSACIRGRRCRAVDTEERDEQILYAARFARGSDRPLVAMGDFNDAAWSDTAQRFKQLRALRRSAGRPRHLRELRRQPPADPLRDRPALRDRRPGDRELRPRAARRFGPLPGDRARPDRRGERGAAEPADAAARAARAAPSSTAGWKPAAGGSRRSGPAESNGHCIAPPAPAVSAKTRETMALRLHPAALQARADLRGGRRHLRPRVRLGALLDLGRVRPAAEGLHSRGRGRRPLRQRADRSTSRTSTAA